jgi:PmbA protein
MEKLLELASKSGCSAEIYQQRTRSVELTRREGRVVDTSASIQSGCAIRIIRNGRMGTAYTKNLLDRQALLDRALLSLENGPEVEFEFPRTVIEPDTGAWHDKVEHSGFPEAQEACVELEDLAGSLGRDCLDTSAGSAAETVRIMNTSGTDILHRSTGMTGWISARYPGTETGLNAGFAGESGIPVNPEVVRNLCEMYTSSLPEVRAGDGRMQVMFLPGSLYGIIWRLTAAAGARAFHSGATPLKDRKGESVLSGKLTLVSDPSLDPPVARRAFDDEGVPTRRLAIFDRGVFTGSYTNLFYAAKLGIEPTGTGFRSGMWGGDTVSLAPEPSFRNGTFQTGEATFEEMLGMMDRGIIAFGLLGAHSGNIINGDFSVGFNPGLLVEKGRIVGRVKDGMMAGNVYDVLKRVVAVQDRPFNPGSSRRDPAVLLDGVSVSGK